jgi:hypothetical protein
MTWWDFWGHEHDDEPPSWDDTNGQEVEWIDDRLYRERLTPVRDLTHWTDRAGQTWALTEMSDLHLENCIIFLIAKEDSHWQPVINAMQAEQQRRKN